MRIGCGEGTEILRVGKWVDQSAIDASRLRDRTIRCSHSLEECAQQLAMLERDSYLKFRRPHDECLLCGTPLPSVGKHPSLLEVTDRDDVIRRDFCPTCWEKSANPSYFSYWVTKRISAPTSRERRLAKSERNEALWRLFSALYASGAEEHRPQLFLLAHLLMRYRILQFKNTSDDGALQFHHSASGETYRVEDVPLDSTPFHDIMAGIEEQAVAFAPTENPSVNASDEE